MKIRPLTRPHVLRAIIGVSLSFLSFAGLAEQEEAAGSALRLSGFGTLGLLHTDAPSAWGYRRDISQPGNDGGTRADIDSRLGVQVNYTPTPQFELVGQVIATHRSPYAPASDSIEWAFAAYRPTADLTLRVGRVNMDAFLMSDYRNVGFASYLSRPPVAFYGSLPSVLDGADVAKVWNLADVQWRAKAYAGSMHGGDLGNMSPVKADHVLGAMVSREAGDWLLRATVTSTRPVGVPAELQPLLDNLSRISALPVPSVAGQARTLSSRLDMSGSTISYVSLGLGYERNNWQLSSELTRVSGHPAANFTAAYASLARRFGALTVFGSAERITTPDSVMDVPAWGGTLAFLGPVGAQQAQGLATVATAAANSSQANQRTLSLGMRWDLKPQLALKLQWDRTYIDAHGSRLWSPATPQAARADISSAVLDFVF